MAEAASAQAIEQLSSLGVKLGHELSVKGTWKAGVGFGVDITLSRKSEIEFGDSPADLVYVLVENLQRVFQIHVGA